MTLSIWRYSHLVLAVSSFLFILIASITGIILAFQPISAEIENRNIPGAENANIAEAVTALQDNYLEVLSLKVHKNNLVSASVITDEGDIAEFYIDPLTGEKAADIESELAIYQFSRNLHRSLFLKSTGRIFIAVTSLLLFLISFTGFILIIKRQRGIRHFFSTIIKDNFYQFWHVYLGRISLIPIILITLTGLVLSVFQLNILSHTKLSHDINTESLTESPAISVSKFAIFKHTPLSEVDHIEFPFSPDVEDFYQVFLKDREILVNQFTGEVVSELRYPFKELAFQWSYNIHTGETSAIWAFILLLASIAILFFVFSGFKITLKRNKVKIKNRYKKSEATHIILVGSETGTTLIFAGWLQKAMQKEGIKAFMAQMDDYEHFLKMENLIICTATYGSGEAPANARKFKSKFANFGLPHNVDFSVIGFGSLAYPDFCKFAYEVEAMLLKNASANQLLPIHPINNKSAESFNQWLRQYNQVTGLNLPAFDSKEIVQKKKKKTGYQVISKSQILPDHHTFSVILKPKMTKKFRSGDLLAITPDENTHDRLYSVGMTEGNELLLSVKLHEEGICSNYLNNLAKGDIIKASRLKNPEFYFPKKAKNVLMIATGTGIAPFLGMLNHNASKKPVHLFWGAKDEAAFDQYSDIIKKALAESKLEKFVPAYSRSKMVNKAYVQDLLKKETELIINTFENKGCIMICGSVLMQKAVLELLAEICKTNAEKPLSFYQNRKQLLMDCY